MSQNMFGNTCIIAGRVSTNQQDYTAQMEFLRAAAERRGLQIVDSVETKESGFRTIDKKEGFNELTEKLKVHDCHIVLATELSRLARKKIVLEQIKQYFIDNKIQLYVEDITFELFDPDGKVSLTADITFSVFAAFAESEMKEKKKRMKRGLQELNLKGMSIMGKTPFGYKKVRSDEKEAGKYRSLMLVDDAAAEQVREIYSMYLNGINNDPTKCSIAQIQQECIARGYNNYLHSHRNVNKALKYYPYTGGIENSKHLRKNSEYWDYFDKNAPKYVECTSCYRLPQIIPPETFFAVQEKMKKVSTRMERSVDTDVYTDKSRSHITLLSKMIVCPVCHSFYQGEYSFRGNRHSFSCYYRCKTRTTHGNFQISMRALDSAIWSFCKLRYEKFQNYIKNFPGMLNVDEVRQRIENISKEKQRQEVALEDLSLRYMAVKANDKSGRITKQFKKDSASIQDKINQCETRIKMEEIRLNEQANAVAYAASMNKTIDYIEGSKEEMQKYIREIVQWILPLQRHEHYAVFQVLLQKGELEILSFETESQEQTNNYILINMRDSWEPKIRYISGPCTFDKENGLFTIEGRTKATIEDAFADEDEVYFKNLPYKRMNLYSYDGPKDANVESFKELPSRAEIGLKGLAARWGTEAVEKNK